MHKHRWLSSLPCTHKPLPRLQHFIQDSFSLCLQSFPTIHNTRRQLAITAYYISLPFHSAAGRHIKHQCRERKRKSACKIAGLLSGEERGHGAKDAGGGGSGRWPFAYLLALARAHKPRHPPPPGHAPGLNASINKRYNCC